MLKLKGRYDWQLINKDTGNVDQEGSQWNTVNDYMLIPLLQLSSAFTFQAPNSGYGPYFHILLSDTVPSSGDYRRAGATSYFNILASGVTTEVLDTTLNFRRSEHNFSPPVGSPRTIQLIGIDFYRQFVGQLNWISFIQLSTPITQNTNQYLYVKYTIYVSYTSNTNDLNSPSNRYIDYYINKGALIYGPYNNNTTLDILIGKYSDAYPASTWRYFSVTPFIEPEDKNNLARSVYIIANCVPSEITNYGAVFAANYTYDFVVADIPGPLGCIAFPRGPMSYKEGGTSPPTTFFDVTFGYNKVKDNLPSFSRVFVHPESRIGQIFSDPSYPPESFGTVTPSGTPTNKYPIVTRIKITKTGDASDVIDDTFTVSGPPTDTLTTNSSQDHLVDELVRFTTTNTLPSPLLADTSYYIVYKSGTSMKVATSQGGTPITLNDAGTGTHTIIRWNTGKYQLELEPWYLNGALRQMVMAIDADNKVQPAVYDDSYDTGEGGSVWSASNPDLVEGWIKIGNYLWTVQKSRVNNVLNICRWYFWSIETSKSFKKFGTSSTVFCKMVAIGTDIYIGTSDGIYKYDTTNPTVAPALITVAGIIDTNIQDLALDPVTGKLWSGHTTGLSKIDAGALTATQYISGTGNALEGMSANDCNIQAGQIDVYNGRVLRAGLNGTDYDASSDIHLAVWVMDDGIGWFIINVAADAQYGGRIRKGTDNIVIRSPSAWYQYSVTVTGKGTGSKTQLHTIAGVTYYSYKLNCQMQQLSDTCYLMPNIHVYVGGYKFYIELYYIGSSVVDINRGDTVYTPTQYPSYFFASGAIPIDVNGNGVFIGMTGPIISSIGSRLGTQFKFGWNGAAWVKDNSGERYIPKTGTHTLLDGTSVAFNNATLKPWDTQFVVSERFTYCYGPYKFKDNLQTVNMKARQYACSARLVDSAAVSVPGAAAYTYHIPATSDPDFRELDTIDFLTEVYEGATRYTRHVIPSQVAFSSDYTTDILTVGVDIATGTPCMVYSPSGYLPRFLVDQAIYYAIRVDATRIKLALTYADALLGTAIDIVDNGSGTCYLQQPVPTTGTYYAGTNGVFVFAAADAGKNLTLTYTYTLFN